MRAVSVAACGIGFVALVVGMILIVSHGDASDSRHQAQLLYRTNHVCDKHGGVLTITPHNASWSFGPWIEVLCQDITVKAIR